jgi:hypothetical protein
LLEASGERERGIVDQDVDAPEVIARATDNLLRRAFDGQITRNREGALANLARYGLGPLAITDVDRNRRSALMQSRRYRTPEAAGGTGHDRDATGKVSLQGRLTRHGCAGIFTEAAPM